MRVRLFVECCFLGGSADFDFPCYVCAVFCPIVLSSLWCCFLFFSALTCGGGAMMSQWCESCFRLPGAVLSCHVSNVVCFFLFGSNLYCLHAIMRW